MYIHTYVYTYIRIQVYIQVRDFCDGFLIIGRLVMITGFSAMIKGLCAKGHCYSSIAFSTNKFQYKSHSMQINPPVRRMFAPSFLPLCLPQLTQLPPSPFLLVSELLSLSLSPPTHTHFCLRLTNFRLQVWCLYVERMVPFIDRMVPIHV